MKIYVSNEVELGTLLQGWGFEPEWWGIGGTKTLTDLWNEVENGECLIVRKRSGRVFRYVKAVNVVILYPSIENPEYILEEGSHHLADGRVRRKSGRLGISEKMRVWGEGLLETSDEAVERLFREELSFWRKNYRYQFLRTDRPPSRESTFKGIISRQVIHRYMAFVTSKGYSRDGYVEEGKGRRVEFKWRLVTQEDLFLIKELSEQ